MGLFVANNSIFHLFQNTHSYALVDFSLLRKFINSGVGVEVLDFSNFRAEPALRRLGRLKIEAPDFFSGEEEEVSVVFWKFSVVLWKFQ